MIQNIEDYLELVKKERAAYFKNSFERAYQAFIELGYDKKPEFFFEQNASMIVEQMREQCWEDFLKEERSFTAHMLKMLIDRDIVKNMTPEKAIAWYVETYPDYIYQLNLSNTQSRRSRAGKEFEDIIELILIGAGIPMDSQGNVGKDNFVQKGLGKLVDAVSPGVIEFVENKRNAVLISAKTSLRERWQEVPEEMGRTGAREMFLATLDERISSEVLNTLYEANVQVTTTKAIKNKYYAENGRVLSFEDLVKICGENVKKWNHFAYSAEQVNQAILIIQKQIQKHEQHDFIKKSYLQRLLRYEELAEKMDFGA